MDLTQALRAVHSGATLAREEAEAVFRGALCEDSDPILFGAFLASLAQRGETPDEIVGAADALRSACTPFEARGMQGAIDTCGTGGDGLGMFNLSTAAAIVACAAGAKVIKHGNRSLSSKCGSADLLEACGIEVALEPEAAARVFEQVGITFLFAPTYHPAMRFAAPVRRALGIRTVFNFLGPLCNPGGVRRQLLGLSDGTRAQDFARVLTALGHERAYVVHGAGGADELTLEAGNRALPVGDAPPEPFEAAALGLSPAPVSALAGDDAPHNARLLAALLDGSERGPLRDAVLLNTSCSLVVAGIAADARDGIERARAALDEGAARGKLDAWRAAAPARD